jgi:transposase
MATRNKHSKLNRLHVVEYIRRRAAARLMSANKRDISLQQLVNEIEDRFGIKAHKSTLQRFLKKLGLGFAWSTAR